MNWKTVLCSDKKDYKLIWVLCLMKKGCLLFKNRKGQIWVETVIYILIAFVMIGLVLSFVRPEIEEMRDKAVIEQSIDIMNNLDSVFSDIIIPGNRRIVDIGIKKGEMEINSQNDTIIFRIDSTYVYSEPGEVVVVGNLNVTTEDRGKYNLVVLKRDFSSKYNITYQNSENPKILSKTSVPYKLIVTNEGGSNRTILNVDLV